MKGYAKLCREWSGVANLANLQMPVPIEMGKNIFNLQLTIYILIYIYTVIIYLSMKKVVRHSTSNLYKTYVSRLSIFVQNLLKVEKQRLHSMDRHEYPQLGIQDRKGVTPLMYAAGIGQAMVAVGVLGRSLGSQSKHT